MRYTRKEFLQLSGSTVGAMALSPLFTDLEHTKRLKNFGIQLYTIRDVFEKDPKGALKQVAAMGYKQVEGYERAGGIFWGMKNTEFKKYIDELGMSFLSSHCDAEKDFEEKAAEAAEIGMKYLIHAWEGPDKNIDDYKKLAAAFNRYGEICRKNGIKFAFHNHFFSFETREGQVPQTVLLENTDPTLVDFELDMYWVVTAGQDPETWLKKYPKRFRLCHIKDRVKGSTKREDTCDLGTGSIDYPSILKTARKNGMEYFIAEQEHYPNSTPMKSTEADAEYMRSLRI
ncbi:MAG: sugar phosphate isomerase/epimerase [Chitinophagaceae bacterium]